MNFAGCAIGRALHFDLIDIMNLYTRRFWTVVPFKRLEVPTHCALFTKSPIQAWVLVSKLN